MRRKYFFTVRGRGNFPFEMLARDQCFPLDDKEADWMRYACPMQTEREISIVFATYQEGGPTVPLWVAARWPVVHIRSE